VTREGAEVASLDVLILGSGVAGLSAAIQAAARDLKVGVMTKADLSQSATQWAQGGVAAVLGGDEDSTDQHLADTLGAGDGLCDLDAVRILVEEGPRRVQELIALGAEFDRDAAGGLSLAREGGHTHARIVHAGGAATGAEIERALVEAVRETAAAVWEGWFALDLTVENRRAVGVVAIDPGGERREVRARHTVMATGGAGQLFAVTTNPHPATGDAAAMARRAGAAVADLEFFQFHPTALHHPAMPRPLLSEALRGHGALLRDTKGEQFVDELLPRDRVSRAMTARMLEQGVDHLWLDATGLESFAERFPTIAASLDDVGLDPAKDWLPIAPAAHYVSGGVLTDLDGATSLPGLWACGEAACTGVHGANRLASNSLLEGMVFAPRVVEAIDRGVGDASPTGAMRAFLQGEAAAISATGVPRMRPVREEGAGADVAKLREELQRAMTAGAGVLRSRSSLQEVIAELERIGGSFEPFTADDHELANLVTVGLTLCSAALAREESRGAHARTDFPDRSDDFARRLVFS
jgi:L-aspartate oxidase